MVASLKWVQYALPGVSSPSITIQGYQCDGLVVAGAGKEVVRAVAEVDGGSAVLLPLAAAVTMTGVGTADVTVVAMDLSLGLS